MKTSFDMLYLSLGNHKVCDAIKITRREWAYRVEDLVDARGLF